VQQKMRESSIASYFSFLRKRSAPNSHFYCLNRERKELSGGEVASFLYYPWDRKDRIFLDGKLKPSVSDRVRHIATIQGVPINYVPLAKLDSFNVSNHEGFIAQISKVHYYELQDIISQVTEEGEVPLFLILDGITDIRNIGGIARTAFCTGVHAIIIPLKGVGALNEDAILTSAGALEKIPVCRVPSLMKAVDELHANGIQVFASEMTAKMRAHFNIGSPFLARGRCSDLLHHRRGSQSL